MPDFCFALSSCSFSWLVAGQINPPPLSSKENGVFIIKIIITTAIRIRIKIITILLPLPLLLLPILIILNAIKWKKLQQHALNKRSNAKLYNFKQKKIDNLTQKSTISKFTFKKQS